MNLKISNDAKLDNNRAGAIAGAELVEGELVGLDASGTVVKADADTAVAVKAVGVSLTDVIDLSLRPNLEDAFKVTLEANKTLVGDRVAFADHGIDLVDNDAGAAYTPGEPVYLAVGGGFTSTNPDPDGSLGHLVQIVGYAISADKLRLGVQF